jgi:hypothetical protein
MALRLPASVHSAFVQKFRAAEELPAGRHSTLIATDTVLEICGRRRPAAAR